MRAVVRVLALATVAVLVAAHPILAAPAAAPAAAPGLVAGAVGVAVADPPAADALTTAVVAAMPGPAAGIEVTVRRAEPAGWAFGTAVRRAPAGAGSYPDGWLWLAHRERGSWRVAREGDPAFVRMSADAPVLAPAERSLLGGPDQLAGPGLPEQRLTARGLTGQGLTGQGLTAQGSAPDYRTGMRLPYAVGQSWTYTGGPHEMSGAPRSSIDLAGGDGRVRAVRDGVAYTMCPHGTGWLRVVHDRGFATDYYHLRDGIAADGRPVSAGDRLGRIGTDVSCGGRATGPHVHLSLRRHGGYVAIDRYALGHWSIRAGNQPYQGYARRGSTRVDVGGALRNHGALGLTEAVVDTDGGGALHRRAGPGTAHEILGTLADGATVRVACSARGTTHTGRGGYRSDLWNRLAGGGWASDVYLWTGTGDPVAGWC